MALDGGESIDDPIGISECPQSKGLLNQIGHFSFSNAKFIWAITLFLSALAVYGIIYGITRINVNDNPVRWFKPYHEIRVAEWLMNENFAGTYSAYLVLRGRIPDGVKEPEVMRYIEALQEKLAQKTGNR